MYSDVNPAPRPMIGGAPIKGLGAAPQAPAAVAIVAPKSVPHTALTVPGRPVYLPGPGVPAAANPANLPPAPRV